MSTVPTVDLSAYFRSPFPGEDGFPSEQQKQVSKQLDSAFRGLGFVILEGLKLDKHLLDVMFQHAKTMFLRPAEEKESKLHPITRPTHVGYFAYGSERLNPTRGGDLKEVRNFCFFYLVFFH